jgi:epoxyqueuosine reductase
VKGLVEELHAEAIRLGFQDLGIATPDESEHMEFFRSWLAQGMHGGMRYLSRPDTVSRRGDLKRTMAGVRSVIVVVQDYFQTDPPGVPEDASRGVVARYGRGRDYHQVLKTRLQDLLGWLRQRAVELGLVEEVEGVAYVDTGPILERELGQRAGLGWFGKNTMLLHPRRGSCFFLGVLLVDLELPASAPFKTDHCGSCQACLEACPTGALLGRDESGAPVMDARRCISYLTIELKGPISPELRDPMANRVFGCDICQEVCPFNRRFSEASVEDAFRAGPDTDGPSLAELMGLSQEEFSSRFSGSPVKRAKRRGFLRNVAVAMGNWLGALREPPEEAVATLASVLSDPEPLVRGHAAWALGRVLARTDLAPDGGFAVVQALADRLEVEEDRWVRQELERAMPGPAGTEHRLEEAPSG